jgi:hypothetical protein
MVGQAGNDDASETGHAAKLAAADMGPGNRMHRNRTGDVRLDDGKCGILRRATASPPAQKPICKPSPDPNDISVLSKSCYGRSLGRNKPVIWRMSVHDSAIKLIHFGSAEKGGYQGETLASQDRCDSRHHSRQLHSVGSNFNRSRLISENC